LSQSLSDRAAERLAQALAEANRHERARLMEEALKLHRQAVEARDAQAVDPQPATRLRGDSALDEA
jgi:hypothetical protein